MSMLVLAGVAGGIAVAGAIAMGLRWSMRQRARIQPPDELPPQDSTPEQPSFKSFGLALGDVILLKDSEAWLTGALRVQDAGEDEALLLFTDQSTEGDVLLVRPSPVQKLFLVQAIDLPDGELAPHSLEHERELFIRTRLIPVTLDRHGEGAPDVSDSGSWSWFESPGGEILVCLRTQSATLAWRGKEAEEGALRLAAGEATFRR